MTLAESEQQCAEHIYSLILESMRNNRPGLTRREIREKRLPGAINGLQPLLTTGRVKKVRGRYVVTHWSGRC